MIRLVRKPYPLAHLPLQNARDNYKDEGALILLPQLDFMNWLTWTEDRRSDVILAKITAVESGLSAIAVVGAAESEENVFGHVYMTSNLMDRIGVIETRSLVRIEPWLEEIPSAEHITVSHDCELAVELGVDIFEHLQRKIMDWPVLEAGTTIRIECEEYGGLIVDLRVTSTVPEGLVRLGGEVGLDICGPAVAAAVAEPAESAAQEPAPTAAEPGHVAMPAVEPAPELTAAEPGHVTMPAVEPAPEPTAAEPGHVAMPAVEPAPELTAQERKKAVRDSWLARFSSYPRADA